MKKLFLLSMLLFVTVFPAYAQDWILDEDEHFEFNCALINQMIEMYGDQTFVRDASGEFGVGDYFADVVPDCRTSASVQLEPNFTVVVEGEVNLRSCAGTGCRIIGQVPNGASLGVVGEEADWYEVIYEGGTAWVASWVTERAADVVIETGESYTIEDNKCVVVVIPQPGKMYANVMISGEERDYVKVALYRPNVAQPLEFESISQKTLQSTGEPYLLQVYPMDVSLPMGMYTIEVSLNGIVNQIGWNVTEPAQHLVSITCD